MPPLNICRSLYILFHLDLAVYASEKQAISWKTQRPLQRRIQNPTKYLRWSVLQKQLTTFGYFFKTLHLRYLTGFWIHLCRLYSTKTNENVFSHWEKIFWTWNILEVKSHQSSHMNRVITKEIHQEKHKCLK